MYDIERLVLLIEMWAPLGLIFKVIMTFILEEVVKGSLLCLKFFPPKHFFVADIVT
jgi:hypothetical protein